MKKHSLKVLSSLLLVFALVFTLVACGGSQEEEVHVFIYKYSDTYIGSVRAELESQLKGADINFKFHDADGSQETQNTQIDNAITAGASLLVVNIVEPGSGDVVVKKAKDAKLPIIFFNREVSDEVIRSYDKATFIGTDPDEAGYMQGKLVADELLANYAKWDSNEDGKINYVMIRADLDNPEANGRTQYSVEEANRLLVAGGKPALVQIGEDTDAGWATDRAKDAMATFIQGNTTDGKLNIEVVFTNNDDMGLGVVQALKEVGYNLEDPTKQVMVVGVDATETALEAISRGEMFGTIKQDGIAMATAIKSFIVNNVEGKSYTEGTDYTFAVSLEDGKAVNKLRIPYSIVK